ncbi:proton-coupled amino acid transporter-like protein pathetic [Melitaea cinxia]|uniref:proton-coupled amino acid transporter-like protein pathetic n=1 Tax=Melitaea cinxia TaxID=113334 RepID=UPI001E27291F|nr:proton-coupled amino acid transporter-like protein pathetic [Melitaea cinxia]
MNSTLPSHTQTQLEFDPASKPPPQPSPDGTRRRFVVHSDKDDYDYVAQRQTAKPTNTLESTAHLVKGCLGGGILGIHEAYMKTGIWTALFTTFLFAFYIAYCIHMLVAAAQTLYKRLHVTEMSYPDLAEASVETGPFTCLKKYSKFFRYVVDATICIDLFGACCVYEIIIAKTIKELIENSTGMVDNDLNMLRLYIFALLVPVLLLCMITTLKYLAPFSLVADVFIVACVVATVYYGLQKAPDISTVPAWKSGIGFFEFCGIVVFGMEGVGVSLPIENNMKDPTKFPLVLGAGMSVVVTFLSLVGFFGYWGFGEETISPVTLNFPKEVFPTVLQCLMGIMIFITFALNFWAPFNLVWFYISKKHNTDTHWIWERVYRAAFVVLITIIAIAFPNIGNLMGLLGAFSLSNIGFIFPALINTLVIWENPGLGKWKWRLWKNMFVLALGVLLFIAGTYSNLKGLIQNL